MLRFLVPYLVLISQHESLALRNVALGKPASQIDTRYNANASRAVDGNLQQYFWKGKSCSLTRTNSSPYWFVDLGAIFDVDHVIIYKRMDPCCSGRLRDVELFIGETKDSYDRVANHSGVLDPVFTFQLQTVTKGRWVKISKVGITGILSLCEVKVMAHTAYGKYSKLDSMEGSGTVVKSLTVQSTIQCCGACLRLGTCTNFNIYAGATPNTSTCDLFTSVASIASSDVGLKHYIVM